MNAQPSEFFSGLISLIFIVGLMLYFLSCDWKFSDTFTIGHIERQPQQQPVYVSVVNQTPAPKKKANRKLFLECVDVMVSLGHKKTLATQKTKKIFEDNEPASVQEFIDIAFRKED